MDEISQDLIKITFSELISQTGQQFGKLIPFFGVKKQAVDSLIKNINETNELSAVEKAIIIANSKKIIKQNSNTEKIIEQAIANASKETDFSESSTIDEEWLERFMDSAKFVQDEEMQIIWGKVLAGEFEKPGSFKKIIIRILSEIPKDYAKVFANICNAQVLLYYLDDKNIVKHMSKDVIISKNVISSTKYDDLGFDFSTLSELNNWGLVNYYNDLSEPIKTISNNDFPNLILKYGDEQITITKYENNNFFVGTLTLTEVGRSLANIISMTPLPNYMQEIKKYFNEKQIEYKE